jgi:class 3 adenylate cyclase
MLKNEYLVLFLYMYIIDLLLSIAIKSFNVAVSIDFVGASNLMRLDVNASSKKINNLLSKVRQVLNDSFFIDNEKNMPTYQNFTGDGVILCFSAETLASIAFSIELNRSFHNLNGNQSRNNIYSNNDEITIGIGYGLVSTVVNLDFKWKNQYALWGQSIARAVRLNTLCSPRQILVDDSFCRLVRQIDQSIHPAHEVKLNGDLQKYSNLLTKDGEETTVYFKHSQDITVRSLFCNDDYLLFGVEQIADGKITAIERKNGIDKMGINDPLYHPLKKYLEKRRIELLGKCEELLETSVELDHKEGEELYDVLFDNGDKYYAFSNKLPSLFYSHFESFFKQHKKFQQKTEISNLRHQGNYFLSTIPLRDNDILSEIRTDMESIYKKINEENGKFKESIRVVLIEENVLKEDHFYSPDNFKDYIKLHEEYGIKLKLWNLHEFKDWLQNAINRIPTEEEKNKIQNIINDLLHPIDKTLSIGLWKNGDKHLYGLMLGPLFLDQNKGGIIKKHYIVHNDTFFYKELSNIFDKIKNNRLDCSLIDLIEFYHDKLKNTETYRSVYEYIPQVGVMERDKYEDEVFRKNLFDWFLSKYKFDIGNTKNRSILDSSAGAGTNTKILSEQYSVFYNESEKFIYDAYSCRIKDQNIPVSSYAWPLLKYVYNEDQFDAVLLIGSAIPRLIKEDQRKRSYESISKILSKAGVFLLDVRNFYKISKIIKDSKDQAECSKKFLDNYKDGSNVYTHRILEIFPIFTNEFDYNCESIRFEYNNRNNRFVPPNEKQIKVSNLSIDQLIHELSEYFNTSIYYYSKSGIHGEFKKYDDLLSLRKSPNYNYLTDEPDFFYIVGEKKK